MDSNLNARYNSDTDTLETLVTSKQRNLYGDTITSQEWTPVHNFPKLTKNYEMVQKHISSILEETKNQSQYQKQFQKELLDLKADVHKLQNILYNHISSVLEETKKQNRHREQLLEEILELKQSCNRLKTKINTGNNF